MLAPGMMTSFPLRNFFTVYSATSAQSSPFRLLATPARLSNSVLTGPGQRTLMQTPCAFASFATARVSE